MSRVKIQVKPDRATTTIAISAVDYLNKFKKKLPQDSIKRFFIWGKTTVGNNIYFEIRSLRVNEFVDILDTYDIRWKHITNTYK